MPHLLRTASGLALALALALPALAQDEAAAPETGAEPTAEPADGAASPAEALAETGTAAAAAVAETGEAAADAVAEVAQAAADVTRDSVVATVNGAGITLGEVLIAAAGVPPQYQQLPPDVLFQGIVEQLVQQELLAQTVTEDSARVTLALKAERRSLLAGEVVGEVAGAVTEEAVQAAYDAEAAAAPEGTEWNAAHILVATEEEAKAAAGRLAAGEDFAALAEELSTDTGSGAQGGDLGWFGPGMMVPEFEAGVAALEPGAVSPPVESQFGWHLIRLVETRPLAAPAFEERAAEIRARLQQEAVQARLQELEAAGEVTMPEPGAFDPALLADPSILAE